MWRKATTGRPAAWEVAGLEWLADAKGARIVRVLERDATGLAGFGWLGLAELTSSPPSRAAAEDFGRALAATHAAGAPAHGVGPDGWGGDGYQGPNEHLLPLLLRPCQRWGQMYAELRIRPLMHRSRGLQGPELEALCDRLTAGEFDTDDAPARIHGDLWSGNVMWTPDGVVLIDPSAHGGHRESDLAALGLFGCPQLERILAAYDECAPLADGWRDRVALHQLQMVAMHAVVFGGGYADQAIRIARQYL
ncbi:MAG: fructosamine kinase family protein [Allobranchiibius sp.]